MNKILFIVSQGENDCAILCEFDGSHHYPTLHLQVWVEPQPTMCHKAGCAAFWVIADFWTFSHVVHPWDWNAGQTQATGKKSSQKLGDSGQKPGTYQLTIQWFTHLWQPTCLVSSHERFDRYCGVEMCCKTMCLMTPTDMHTNLAHVKVVGLVFHFVALDTISLDTSQYMSSYERCFSRCRLLYHFGELLRRKIHRELDVLQ